MDLPWLDGINHRVSKRRIPSVLTRNKVAGVLAQGLVCCVILLPGSTLKPGYPSSHGLSHNFK